MEEKKAKLICCKALAHLVDQLDGYHFAEVVTLDIGLHLSPEKLRTRLLEEVQRIEEEGTDIFLAYGLCGRALEGVVSQKSRLILPMVDDCVGLLLGSRSRHREILAEIPGCFFMESEWLGTEQDIFYQSQRGLENLPEARRGEIVKLTLKHYTTLSLFEHNPDKPQALVQCQELASEHGLNFRRLASDLSLLHSLLRAETDNSLLLVVNPGEKIPFF